MAVSKINNTFYLSNNYQSQPINFGDSFLQPDAQNTDKKNSSSINKLSEEEIRYYSELEPNKRFINVSKNVYKALLAIPAIDTIASTITQNGNFASKVLKGSKTAVVWTVAFAAGTLISGIKHAVNSKSEFFDNINKNYPVASTIVDIAAMYGAFAGILTGAGAIKNKITSKFPSLTEKMKNNVKKPVKNLLNKSVINKRIVIPSEKYFEKHTDLLKTKKMFASLIVPVLFTGVLVRYLNEAKYRDNTANENYKFLKSINDSMPDTESEK